MATFAQAVGQLQKGNLKRVTWICGAEPSLREELVDSVRRVGQFDDVVRRTAGEDSESSIWDAVNQYSFDPTQKRLVLVRDAEKISNWEPLRDWMEQSRRMPNTYLLFVSAEPKLRRLTGQDGKEHLIEPLTFITNRGYMIECRPPNEDDFAAWVKWRTGTEVPTARRLIKRCGGDVARVHNVVKMVAPLGPLTPQAVDLLVEQVSPADFIRNLLVLDKTAALGSLPEGETALKTLGALDYLLDVMAVLHPLLRRQAPMREIAEEKRVPIHLARQLLEHSKHYDAPAIRRRREVLAAVDEVAQTAGPVPGLLESLVALW